ncbi:MAG: NACHT domain-containing protein [Leptolyngbyaceae cyanobacterium MO_188.B28]|nr:NACHT domain-containing protein [Leptolyngbyaceae cyanobacterium MO_188.B28]
MPLSQERILIQWTLANNALRLYFQGNQGKLADYVQLPPSTVAQFFKAAPINANQFRIICLALRLNAQEVSAVFSGDAIAESPDTRDLSPSSLRQDSLPPQLKYRSVELIYQIYIQALGRHLIEQARDRCRQTILNRYSRIRLLNGAEIGVDQGYVDVWSFEKTDNQYFSSPESLFKAVDIGKNHLSQGKRLERYSSLEAVSQKTKLVLLGKPGAGKSTFLKRLAVDWGQGRFQPEQIAILIELTHIRDQQWTLLQGIDQTLGLNSWGQFSDLKTTIEQLKRRNPQGRIEKINRKIAVLSDQLETLPLQIALKQGKLLILLDGLNELPTKILKVKIQEQLRQLSDEYPDNRFILTCRTQAMGAMLDGFACVELADYNPQQVDQFVNNWFKASGASDAKTKAQREKISRIVAQKSVLKAMPLTPMQLSLMCLIFENGGAITSDQTWLYKTGVRLLLSRWRDDKPIEEQGPGCETYRQLPVKEKEALLQQILACQLEHPRQFGVFDQAQLADQITRQLRLASRREGVGVLKSIETQHGLLIEHADKQWSFADPTFQEYFTIQWLTQLSAGHLAQKIADPQWQEIVKKLARSQQPADRLLQRIKQAIDQSVARDPAVQTFLNWLFQKCQATLASYKPSALRAFYYALNFNLEESFERILDPTLDPTLNLDLDLDRALFRTLYRALNLEQAFEIAFNRASQINRTLNRSPDLNLNLNRTFDRILNQSLDRTLDLNRTIDRALDYTLNRALNLELTNTLQQLRVSLPVSNHWKGFYEWWEVNGPGWIEQLRQTMIQHREIGKDWQFTEEQTQRLETYYTLNQFLVDLMDIKGAVSNPVRTEIEDSLLLPWSVLQRRQLGMYGKLE